MKHKRIGDTEIISCSAMQGLFADSDAEVTCPDCLKNIAEYREYRDWKESHGGTFARFSLTLIDIQNLVHEGFQHRSSKEEYFAAMKRIIEPYLATPIDTRSGI